MSFLKKHALEQAIQLVGEEVHRQYILTFEPKVGEPGKFHAVRVEVKDRPGGKREKGKGDRRISARLAENAFVPFFFQFGPAGVERLHSGLGGLQVLVADL